MPKVKTNRSAVKRFRVNSKGKIKMAHSFKNHILTKKRSKRKLKLRKHGYVHPSSHRNMLRLLNK